MEKAQKLSEITTDLINQVQSLQRIANELSKLIGDFSTNYRGLDTLKEILAEPLAKIIPFPLCASPGATIDARSRLPCHAAEKGHRIIDACCSSGRLLAAPGEPLPDALTDYRPLLQRDGLILLSWDKRITEMGERYSAYWVTSAGVPRFYASRYLSPEDFPSARPDHKSYAAEDGIEFYGQETPVYVVHVAPELMMNNPLHGDLRLAHIQTLKDQGSTVDFNYKYLLKTAKEKNRESKGRGSKGCESKSQDESCKKENEANKDQAG